MSRAISIIIPIYNAEPFLTTCLESVLSQSFKDFELILINDGSTDGSLAICQNYVSRDSRIKIIDKCNEGVSIARNAGLKTAQGQWICFIDADDYILPETLSKLYTKATGNGADIVFGNTQKLEDGNFSLMFDLKEESSNKVIGSIRNLALWGYLFRANLIKDNHIHFIEGLAYSEDAVFIYQVALHSHSIAFVNAPVYVYRINQTSACASPDGMKKAYHQFHAAYHLRTLAKSNRKNKDAYRIIKRDEKRKINMGFYQFVKYSFSYSGIKSLSKLYFSFMKPTMQENILFYIRLIKNYLIERRRRIITFRK